MQHSTVGIVGAGPIGLELAVALKQTNIPYIQFDKGQVAQMVYNFPPQTRFFSSSERIGIAGIPIQTVDQQKCPREEYLAYIRSVVMSFGLEVNTYEEITQIRILNPQGFQLTSQSSKGEQNYHVRYVVLATGGTSFPRLLKVPGENLPHVSIKMEDPHKYFLKKVVVIGAKNSAVETALRCYHAGAKVTLILRNDHFDPQHVKYWLLPELQGRIERKEINSYFSSEILEILRDRIRIRQHEQTLEVFCDFVIKAIGFEANMELFHQVGVALSPERQAVLHDESMQTNVSGVYVLGTVVAGTQERYRVFIENTHDHVERIMKDLCRKLSISPCWTSPQRPSNQRLEE